MDKFKKWRKQRKPIMCVPEATNPTSNAPPPVYETDPPLVSPPSAALKFGLKLLYDCPNAIVDICFVHGLTGDRDKTWTAVGQTTPWPKILLPPKLNARILMYGYDAHIARKSVASSNRLINHAQNLLGDLTADRSFCNASSRPLIFVAHSLGGLVCKKAILLSQNAAEPQLRALFGCLEGIAFMGTPHKGAWMADWAKIPASVFGLVKSTNVTLLDILQRDNQLLDSIQVDFVTMIRRLRESGRAVGVACFFEELPFPVVGKIVTEESATLDGYDIYSIYANHRDMVRFGSEEDPGFKRLLWKLLTWTSHVDDQTAEHYTFNAEDRACLRDLQTTNPRDDKSRIEATKGGLLRNSYNWALEDEGFLEWHHRERDGGILWVRGDPGKGKTMLLCGIIDELSDMDQGYISFFFCQATDTRLNCATAVLRGLIYMFIDQEPALISHVRQRYDESGKQLFENPNAWHALSKIFVDMLDHITDPCLIIDALDECTTGLSSLLELIVQVSSTHPHVKWIVSSRNWPEIKEHMSMISEKRRITLEMNESSVSEAVKIFILHRVKQLAKLKGYTQQIFDAVYSHLLSNAQGTFLWVALVCERLAVIPRLRTIEKLHAFPSGLDALYQRMIQQVYEHDEAPLCKDILGLVSTTYRPITIDELTAFIDVPEYVLEDGYESLEEIIGYCGSFLTISKNTLTFVHNSAKEFLLEKATHEILPSGIAGKNVFILEQSLKIMDKILRRDILSLGESDDPTGQAHDESLSLGPLAKARYSCVYWIDHLRACDQKTAIRDYFQEGGLVDYFLAKRFLFWLEALSLLKSVPKGLEEMLNLEALARETPILSQVQDASRFFRYHSSMFESNPLEVYNSVLIFTPTCSRIKTSFQEEAPDWVEIKPAIEDWNSCTQTLQVNEIAGFEHLEWAPDGTRLTSVSADGAVKIWDLAGSRCVSSFETHGLVGTSVTWSSDGAYIASASSDLQIKIWNPETGQCLSTLPGHEFPINAVFWSEDATRLVSVSWSRKQENPSPFTIKVWDRMTSQCVLTVNGNNNPISSAFPSYDGKGIVSMAQDGIIKTWEIFTDQRISSRKVYPQRNHISLWTNDGTSLFHSDWLSNTINILDPSTWRPIAALSSDSGHQIVSLALSHNGNQLASGSKGGIVEIWDLTTGERVSTLNNNAKYTTHIIWLRDGRLVSGSYDAIIKIWDPSTSQCLSTFHGQRGDICSLLLWPDETRLISTAAFDSTIKIWDLSSFKAIEGHSQEVTGIVWSHDGSSFASYSNEEIKVWDPFTGKCLSTLANPNGNILKICWSLGGELASLSSTGTIFIWDISTGQVSWTIESIEPSAVLTWSLNGSQLMLASYENLVNTWDTKARRHLSTVKVDKIGIWVTWSHDATRFASVAENWSIMIQNPYTGKCISHLEGHHCPEVDQIPLFLRRQIFMSWSCDGTRLASVMGPTIKIWDLISGQCTLVLELDEDPDRFQFNFPRGPSFGETDPRYFHTSIGSFDIAPNVDPTTDGSARLICSPRQAGFGISQSGSWITHDGVKLLALPSDYGPRVPEAVVLSSSTVVIGSVSGRVLIFKFLKKIPVEQ